MINRNCLECECSINGRSDKKFCSDYCRNTFNNRVNKDGKNLIRNINNRLRKNRRILDDLNPKGQTEVSKNILDNHGFDFNLHTNVFKSSTGEVYYYCYDQGYSLSEDNCCKILKMEEKLMH